MSMGLASQVWSYKLDKTTLVILMALCDIANDDGTHCHPSIGYVSWKTGTSVATVYRVIEMLEKGNKEKGIPSGVLVMVGYVGDTPEYEIHLEQLALKPRWERPRRGRPRADKSSHGEKSFSERETNRTVRKDSQDEKSPLTVRKDSSPREKFSHSEKTKRRLRQPEMQTLTAPASKRDVSEPYLVNHTYDPDLVNGGASTTSFTLNRWAALTKDPDACRWLLANDCDPHEWRYSKQLAAYNKYVEAHP